MYVYLRTAAGAGIGLEATRALAKTCAQVIVHTCNPEKAREVLVEISNAEVESLDMMNAESIDAFVHRAATSCNLPSIISGTFT
ncbi:SDR family NAD(P)-dependent oxidoreductase [Paenibacillus sp. GCM10027628]|uniref:SDR family NAD(P)-dependent oxidoreductase n=1 Tax=Paenibacillus sp. GCM10027628 TaxID=3273413 RepID=UPI003640EA9E